MANKLDEIKALTKIFYDHQSMRIQNGNRIASLYRTANFSPSEKMSDDEKEEGEQYFLMAVDEYNDVIYPKCIDPLTREYKTKKRIEAFLQTCEFIKTYPMMKLMQGYVNEYNTEMLYQKAISDILSSFPIYTEFLKGIKGIGPLMSAVIITSFDIHKARHVSSFWKYAGLDVVLPSGEARSRKADHLVDVEYTDKKGNIKTKKSITYNPFLKTKLLGVLSGCFIKAGNKEYRKIYDDYKNRISIKYEHEGKELTPGHLNNMAKRYMIKMFVKDLWNKWREIEGYPKEADWYETYILGRNHGENYSPSN